MKYAALLTCLLLAGCSDYDAFKAACEAKGGESFWLRNDRPLCIKKDALVPLKRVGDYQ